MNLRKDHYRAKQSALTDTGGSPPVDVLVRGFASISAKCGKARDTSASPSLVVINGEANGYKPVGDVRSVAGSVDSHSFVIYIYITGLSGQRSLDTCPRPRMWDIHGCNANGVW